MTHAPRWRERLEAWGRLAAAGTFVRHAVARLLVATRLSRHLVIRRGDYRLRFFPTSLSISLWVNPDDRKGDEQFLRRILREGDTVVDIGANIGQLSVVAAKCVGSSGRVLSFEPHPEISRYLVENLALNEATNVTVHRVAVGAGTQTVYMSNRRNDDANSVVAGAGLAVEQHTLDDSVPDGPVTLLKIDVEGYELDVLAGARAVLGRTACVFVESFEPQLARFGRTTSDLVHALRDSGFTVLHFDGFTRITTVPPGHVSTTCENLIAIRPAFEERLAAYERT